MGVDINMYDGVGIMIFTQNMTSDFLDKVDEDVYNLAESEDNNITIICDSYTPLKESFLFFPLEERQSNLEDLNRYAVISHNPLLSMTSKKMSNAPREDGSYNDHLLDRSYAQSGPTAIMRAGYDWTDEYRREQVSKLHIDKDKYPNLWKAVHTPAYSLPGVWTVIIYY